MDKKAERQPAVNSDAGMNAPDGMRKIDVRYILQDDNAVCLEFEGMQYILRITSNRKLILTK